MISLRQPDAREAAPAGPDYIRTLAAASGLTRTMLAARLGVNVRTLGRWLSGTAWPPYAAVYCLESLAAHGAAQSERARETLAAYQGETT